MRKDWMCLFFIPLLFGGAVGCSSGGSSSSSEPTEVADDSISVEPAPLPVLAEDATHMLFLKVKDPLADGDSGKLFPVTLAIDGTSVTVTDPCGQEPAGTGTLSEENQLDYTTTTGVYSGIVEELVTTDGLTCGRQWLDAKLEVTDSDREIDSTQNATGVLLVDNGQLTGPHLGSALSKTVVVNSRIRSYFYSMYDGLPAWFRYAQPTYEFIRGGYVIGDISLKIGISITKGVTVEVEGWPPYTDCYEVVYNYIYAEEPPATSDYPVKITRYFKEDIGVVKVVEETMDGNVFTAELVNYLVDGTGVVPLVTDNFWEFSWDKSPDYAGPFTETIMVKDVIPDGTVYNLAPGDVP